MQTNHTHTRLNPLQHQLTVEFPWDEVLKRIPDSIRKYQRNSTFDGFRKGKAPESVVQARIGDEKPRESSPARVAGLLLNRHSGIHARST